VGLAIEVEDAGGGVVAEAEGAVLVAYAFEGDAFFEVSVERNVGVGVTGLLEDFYPAVFEAIEGFCVVGSVRELDVAGGCGGDSGGLVRWGDAGVWMGTGRAWGNVGMGCGRGVSEGNAIVGVRQVFRGEPPGDRVAL